MRIKIQYQILLIAMIPVLLIDGFFTYVLIKSNVDQAEQLVQVKGEIIAQQIAAASEFGLLSGDYQQIRLLLQQSINTNNIIFIAVHDRNGHIVGQTKSSLYRPEQNSEYSYYRKNILTHSIASRDIFEPETDGIKDATLDIGRVHMYISRQQLKQDIAQILQEGAYFFFLMFFLAILLTLIISKRITRPIYNLLNHLKRIETGHLGEAIEELEENEIRDLQKGFNSMSQALLTNRRQLDAEIESATGELKEAVSKLELNNQELANARDIAQKADRVKSQFLANMSHEIRTPINGIKGFLNLLFKTGLNKEQLRYADIITQSTRDLSNTVNEILDFSKIESGKIEILHKPFDLHQLVESTRDSLFASTIEKNIDLYLSIFSDTPKVLIGDEFHLKQILINLVGNAIKFTDRGFVSITVMLEDESDKQAMLRFNIEDSGIGITDENQKILFQAFKQLESNINRRFTGTGLGLVISRNLAVLMGGNIQLSSQPGKGSLFSMMIPFDKSAQKADFPDIGLHDTPRQTVMIYTFDTRAMSELQSLYNRAGFNVESQLIADLQAIDLYRQQLLQNINYINFVVFDLRHSLLHPDQLIPPVVKNHGIKLIVMHYDPTLVNQSGLQNYHLISVINSSKNLHSLMKGLSSDDTEPDPLAEEIPSQNAKTILIVDDNPINLSLATELTRLWGHRPVQADHAKRALQLFKVLQFDLILLDIQMPEVDGIELMNMMRSQQPGLSTPIIAITANAFEKEQQRLLDLGFDGYMSKPVDEQKLKKLLDMNFTAPNGKKNVKVHEANRNKVAVSLDYAQTLKLCADQHTLADSTLSMLKQELPVYVSALNFAIGSADREKIDAIMHILHGIVCYASLPALKKHLFNYNTHKNAGTEELLQSVTNVRDELKKVEQALQQMQTSNVREAD